PSCLRPGTVSLVSNVLGRSGAQTDRGRKPPRLPLELPDVAPSSFEHLLHPNQSRYRPQAGRSRPYIVYITYIPICECFSTNLRFDVTLVCRMKHLPHFLSSRNAAARKSPRKFSSISRPWFIHQAPLATAGVPARALPSMGVRAYSSAGSSPFSLSM